MYKFNKDAKKSVTVVFPDNCSVSGDIEQLSDYVNEYTNEKYKIENIRIEVEFYLKEIDSYYKVVICVFNDGNNDIDLKSEILTKLSLMEDDFSRQGSSKLETIKKVKSCFIKEYYPKKLDNQNHEEKLFINIKKVYSNRVKRLVEENKTDEIISFDDWLRLYDEWLVLSTKVL